MQRHRRSHAQESPKNLKLEALKYPDKTWDEELPNKCAADFGASCLLLAWAHNSTISFVRSLTFFILFWLFFCLIGFLFVYFDFHVLKFYFVFFKRGREREIWLERRWEKEEKCNQNVFYEIHLNKNYKHDTHHKFSLHPFKHTYTKAYKQHT